ncbi:MAG: HAD family hydrolase [Oscillospiraceae bacterium]|nr:HAD family hydrolase [Oscillospiraceae bacterium]
MKLLLFDLDGTLLHHDKTLSERTIKTLERCREQGYILGIATARGEYSIGQFVDAFKPQVIISNSGAQVRAYGEKVYTASFPISETRRILGLIKEICGDNNIMVDTDGREYRNFIYTGDRLGWDWGEIVIDDFSDFNVEALKICTEIPDPEVAQRMINAIPEYYCGRYSDGFWHEIGKKEVTKAYGVEKLCETGLFSLSDITAFGDEFTDIGMLKLCGTGVAMGNAIPETKEAADIVIGTNEEDGVAEYLETLLV